VVVDLGADSLAHVLVMQHPVRCMPASRQVGLTRSPESRQGPRHGVTGSKPRQSVDALACASCVSYIMAALLAEIPQTLLHGTLNLVAGIAA
jgi:hypothetical protein